MDKIDKIDKFYEWFNDKAQVICAVLVITILGAIVIPDKIDLNIVYGGLFGLAAGIGLAGKK